MENKEMKEQEKVIAEFIERQRQQTDFMFAMATVLGKLIAHLGNSKIIDSDLARHMIKELISKSDGGDK